MTDIAEIKNRLVNIGLAVSDLPIVPAMVEGLAEQIAQYVEQQSAALAASQARVEELERWKGVVSEYAANCLDEPDDKKQMQSAMGVIGFIIMQRERATIAEAEIARLREARQDEALPYRALLDGLTAERELADRLKKVLHGLPDAIRAVVPTAEINIVQRMNAHGPALVLQDACLGAIEQVALTVAGIARAALTTPGEDEIVRPREALLSLAQAVVADHDDLEDRAYADPRCIECNLGTGPHKRTCAYHLARAALATSQARVEELERHIRSLALTHTPEAMKLWRGECKHYWLTDQDGEVCRRCAAEAEIARLREAIINREARRMEILDWLQEKIGTDWPCERCGHFTYHAFANQCADCGEEFPLLNRLAFKLHASGTDNAESIGKARAALAEPVAVATPGEPCEHEWEPRTSRAMGVNTWQCLKCGEFGGSPKPSDRLTTPGEE